MDKLKLVDEVEKAYKEYYLYKALNEPTSSFSYKSEVTKFISWLRDEIGESQDPKGADNA